jgi:hypothetical protein
LFASIIALMMEAASTFETFVNYQTTRRCNPEDSHLRTHRRENLKSYQNIGRGHRVCGPEGLGVISFPVSIV